MEREMNQSWWNLHHESQHKSIPDNIAINSHHIHLDPCYKRIETLILS